MEHADQIAAGLARLSLFQRTRDWRRSERLGLTATQTQILVHLANRGPMRVTAVADGIGVRQPTATDAVRALVRKGLVERHPDPADARATLLHLTTAGRKTLRDLEEWPDAMVDAVESLDEDERAAMLRSLTTIVRKLQAGNQIPVQRMCVGCKYFRPRRHDGAKPHHCNFVDAPFGDAELRLDCGEYESAPEAQAAANFRRFRARGS